MYRHHHAPALATLALVMGWSFPGSAQGPSGASPAGETLSIRRAGERLSLGPHTVMVKPVVRNQFGYRFRSQSTHGHLTWRASLADRRRPVAGGGSSRMETPSGRHLAGNRSL